jgi:hypothetical protein
MRRGKEVVASFQLVLENIGSLSFLKVIAYKSRGHSLLPVGSNK